MEGVNFVPKGQLRNAKVDKCCGRHHCVCTKVWNIFITIVIIIYQVM